jgi:hypothetical protein
MDGSTLRHTNLSHLLIEANPPRSVQKLAASSSVHVVESER